MLLLHDTKSITRMHLLALVKLASNKTNRVGKIRWVWNERFSEPALLKRMLLGSSHCAVSHVDLESKNTASPPIKVHPARSILGALQSTLNHLHDDTHACALVHLADTYRTKLLCPYPVGLPPPSPRLTKLLQEALASPGSAEPMQRWHNTTFPVKHVTFFIQLGQKMTNFIFYFYFLKSTPTTSMQNALVLVWCPNGSS